MVQEQQGVGLEQGGWKFETSVKVSCVITKQTEHTQVFKSLWWYMLISDNTKLKNWPDNSTW